MTGFKTDISKQGTKFELVFYTDNKDYFEKVQSVASECIDHKPITQFDRIKAMSVEKLAEFLENTNSQCAIKVGGELIVRHKDYIKIWLESEVQGE